MPRAKGIQGQVASGLPSTLLHGLAATVTSRKQPQNRHCLDTSSVHCRQVPGRLEETSACTPSETVS